MTLSPDGVRRVTPYETIGDRRPRPDRTGEERCRHFEAERLGGLEIDDELEFCGLLDRKMGGFRSV
jgi:hypothetical protein